MIRIFGWTIWVTALITAVFGPLLAQWLGLPDPNEPLGSLFESASREHWLGTDRLGRDIGARMLAGNGVLVLVPAVAAVLSSFLGLVVGTCVALVPHSGIRIVLDALLVMPPIVVMLAIAATTGLSPTWLVFGSVLVTLPFSSRFFESTVRKVLAAGFLETARCAGDSWYQVFFFDVLPVLMRPLFTDSSLRFVATVYFTATASFLGAGQGGDTWATLIHSGLSGVTLNPWGVVAPAIAIIALTVPPSLLFDQGDGL